MGQKLIMNGSLTTRITAFSLFIFVTSLWTLSFFATRTLQEDMQRLLGEQQFSAVSALAKDIDAELTERMRALEIIANDVDAGLIDHPTALQARLEKRQILQVLFNGGAWLAGADGTARAVVRSSVQRIGVNYMDRDDIAAALKEGKSSIGRPVTAKTSSPPIFSIAVPVRDVQGRVIGALAGVIDLGKPNFLDKITQNRYGTSGGFFLIAPQQRLVITATDKSRVMQTLPPSGVNPAIDRFVDGFEGYAVLVNAVGVSVLSSYRVIPSADWAVSASLPTDEAFAPIHEMQQRMLLATLVLTVLAGGLTWWMLRRQLSPLGATAEAMASLAKNGETTQPLPVIGRDEISLLAGGFNRIVESWVRREGVLRESEHRAWYVIDASPAPIVQSDAQGNTVLVNPAFVRMLGYTRDDFRTRDEWAALAYPDPAYRKWSTEDARQLMENAARTGEPTLSMERKVRCKDGSDRIFLIHAPVPQASTPGADLVFLYDITDRKKAELALQEREARLAFLLTATPAVIYTARSSGDFGLTFVSENVQAMTGYQAREFTADASLRTDCTHPGDKERVLATTMSLLELGQAQGEYRFRHQDGRYRWLLDQARLLRDESGQPTEIVGSWLDITERKEADARADIYRRLHESQFDAFAMVAMDGRLLKFNSAYQRMLGYTAEELKTLTYVDLTPEKWREVEAVIVADQVLPHGHSAVYEKEYIRKDGTVIAVELRTLLMRDSGGQAEAMWAIVRDISERKRHEEALHASEARYRALAENSADWIWHADLQNNTTYSNDRGAQMLGVSADEMRSLTPAALVHPDDLNRLTSTFQTAVATQTGWRNVLVRFRRKDGSYCATESSASPHFGPDGNLVGFNGIDRDVTDRLATEAELSRYRDQLEALVEARTAALQRTNRKLIETQYAMNRVGIAIHWIDAETGKLLYANKTAAEMLGYTESEFLGLHISDIEPGYSGKSFKLETEAFRRQRHIQTESAHLTKGRRLVPVEVMLHFLAGDADEPPRFIAFVQDITERQVAEEALRASNAMLDAALSGMSDAVLISDREGRVIRFNDAYVDFHRFKNREECSRSLAESPTGHELFLVDGEPAPREQWPIPRALRGETANGVEYKLRRRSSGEYCVGSYSLAPIRSKEGDIVGAVITARDVTALKRTQADLESAHAALHRLISNMDSVQENERRRIARELHDDLQQMLATIKVYAKVIADDWNTGATEMPPSIAAVQKLTDMANITVRRIINDLRPQLLEHLGLVPALEMMTERLQQDTGIHCSLVADEEDEDDEWLSPAATTCLYRVAQEALNNVARHALASTVEVRLCRTAEAQVLLSVRDDGIGMEPVDRVKPQSFGLLGMQERLFALGGTLYIDSKPGIGTTVEATVPCSDPP